MTVADAPNPLLGREYLRVSKDKSGRGRSPNQQHDDNMPVATEMGITLIYPAYRDDDRSASRHARKIREDFGRLIADLEADQFGARVLVLWESSRGSRQVEEWVQLLKLLRARRVKILVTTHRRLYDPALPRDWRSLMDDAVESEYQSDETHLRVLRDVAANAAAGRPHAVANFGFKRIYDDRSGELLEQVADPVEAPLVAEMFERMDRGESIRSIERDWERRQIRDRYGRGFSSSRLRKMARNPAYIGLRVHDPDRVHHPTQAIRPESRVVKAIWPPLVERELFDRVQAILTDPGRLTRRGGDSRAQHLLSMIAVCGVCGEVVDRTRRQRKDESFYTRYRCKTRGCVVVDQDSLDAFATEAIFAFVARLDNYGGFVERSSADLEAAEKELAEAHAEHEELASLSVRLAARMEPPVLAKIARLESVVAELRVPTQLAGLLRPGEDIRARWADPSTPMSVKRSFARAVFSASMLGTLAVLPQSERGGPVGDRVEFRTS